MEATDVFLTAWNEGGSNDDQGNRDYFKPPFVLEANIFPHLIFRQTYTDVLEVESQTSRGEEDVREVAYSLSGTPGVRLRILTSESKPVRTPTFTPRLNFQLLWARGLKEKYRVAFRELKAQPISELEGPMLPSLVSANRGSIGLYEAHMRLAHYSNGQEGCQSLNQSRGASDQSECMPADVIVTRNTINRKNGSFATNFVALGFNYNRNSLRTTPVRPGSPRDWLARRELRVGGEVEWHFRNDDVERYYSPWRLNASAGAAWRDAGFCKRRLDFALGATAGQRRSGVNNTSASAQVTCLPMNRGGWGLFARYVGGQDYYNVQLFETIHRLQVGLTYGQNGFFGFRSRPPGVNGGPTP